MLPGTLTWKTIVTSCKWPTLFGLLSSHFLTRLGVGWTGLALSILVVGGAALTAPILFVRVELGGVRLYSANRTRGGSPRL